MSGYEPIAALMTSLHFNGSGNLYAAVAYARMAAVIPVSNPDEAELLANAMNVMLLRLRASSFTGIAEPESAILEAIAIRRGNVNGHAVSEETRLSP